MQRQVGGASKVLTTVILLLLLARMVPHARDQSIEPGGLAPRGGASRSIIHQLGRSQTSVTVSRLSRSHPGVMADAEYSRCDDRNDRRNLNPRSREPAAERSLFGDAGLLPVRAAVLARPDRRLDPRPVRSLLVGGLQIRCS